MSVAFGILGGTAALLAALAFIGYLGGEFPFRSAIQKTLIQFLGVPSPDKVQYLSSRVPLCFRVDYQRAFQQELTRRGWSVRHHSLTGARSHQVVFDQDPSLNLLLTAGFQAQLGATRLTRVQTGPSTFEQLAVDGLYLVEGGEHAFVAALHHSRWEAHEFTFEILIASEETAGAWALDLMKELDEWVIAHSCFRGQMIRPRFSTLLDPDGIDFQEVLDSSNLYLDDEVRLELDRSFLDFKRHADRLRAAGIEVQRGLLLCGPPGTGKTSTCRYLKDSLPDHTFLSVPLKSLQTVEGVFNLARRLTPAVVIFEDVDLYAMSRERNMFTELLGEMMNQMDGLSDRDGIDVLMTSNSWQVIESALAHRPGRIDHVVMYEVPNGRHRHRLLEKFLDGIPHRANLETLVEMSEDLTPAQIKELVKRATIFALERRGSTPDAAGSTAHALEVLPRGPDRETELTAPTPITAAPRESATPPVASPGATSPEAASTGTPTREPLPPRTAHRIEDPTPLEASAGEDDWLVRDRDFHRANSSIRNSPYMQKVRQPRNLKRRSSPLRRVPTEDPTPGDPTGGADGAEDPPRTPDDEPDDE